MPHGMPSVLTQKKNLFFDFNLWEREREREREQRPAPPDHKLH